MRTLFGEDVRLKYRYLDLRREPAEELRFAGELLRSVLAGLPRVRVVHGSGMGILRKALRQYLQKHPHVESVTEPPQNEGGGGATVVEANGRPVTPTTSGVTTAATSGGH